MSQLRELELVFLCSGLSTEASRECDTDYHSCHLNEVQLQCTSHSRRERTARGLQNAALSRLLPAASTVLGNVLELQILHPSEPQSEFLSVPKGWEPPLKTEKLWSPEL